MGKLTCLCRRRVGRSTRRPPTRTTAGSACSSLRSFVAHHHSSVHPYSLKNSKSKRLRHRGKNRLSTNRTDRTTYSSLQRHQDEGRAPQKPRPHRSTAAHSRHSQQKARPIARPLDAMQRRGRLPVPPMRSAVHKGRIRWVGWRQARTSKSSFTIGE